MTAPSANASPAQPRSNRRVIAAGFLGTTIEYYDFFIYGTAAALVFPMVFFPALGAAAATTASFATFAVAFIARPIGGVVFGHIGDRVGRKTTLVATLLIMGVATVLIGVLPSGASIGVLAPIALIALRFLQGLAVGGEWSSAALFVSEYAPKGKRGLYALSPALGTMVGLLVATVTFLITGLAMSDEAFLSWGWRVPFLLSAVLVAVGLWIRLGIAETPVFQAAMAKAELAKQNRAPVVEMFRHQWREVFLASGSVLVWLSFFYIGAVYLTNYGTTALGLPRNTMLAINLIAVVVCIAGGIVGARWSDRVGRRQVLIVANGAAVPWAFVMFPLMDTANVLMVAVGMSVTLFLVGMATGAATALLPEIFRTSYRSTGTGVSFNLGSVVGGGIPPIVAAPLFAAYGSTGLSIMLALIAVIATLSVLALRETRGRSLEDDPVTGADTAQEAAATA
jgi:metabolite-proton symporter